MVAVVDDRDDVWLNSLENLFKIEPYKFWKGTKEINNQSGDSLLSHGNSGTHSVSAMKEQPGEIDEHLNICYDVLIKAHEQFYNQISKISVPFHNDTINIHNSNTIDTTKQSQYIVTNQMIVNQLNNTGPSIPSILTTIRKSILRSCNIVFTGIIPQEIEFIEHPFIRLAYFYGGQVSRQIQEGVTHVVCAQPGTEKSIRGAKQGCFVVTKFWFLDSITKWKRMNENQYIFPEIKKYIINPSGSSKFSATGLKLNWDIKGSQHNPFRKNKLIVDDDAFDALLNNEINHVDQVRDDNNAEVHEPSYKRLRSNDDTLYEDDINEKDEIEVDYGDEELIDEEYFL